MFIICQQLNGPVLKSLKPKRSGPKSKKNGLAGTRPKFQYLFRAGPGPGQINRAREDFYIAPVGEGKYD